MNRRTATRLTVAAAVAVGLSFGVAPQWVSGSTDASPEGGGTAAPRAAVTVSGSVDSDAAGTVDLSPATSTSDAPDHTPPADEPAPTVSPDAVVTVDPEPVPSTVPAPTPPPAVPETDAEEPAPAESDVRGAIHIDVAAVDGATRSVSLLTGDGARVGGPLTVEGDRLSFTGLADGTYDLLVEQVADGGGASVTRTIVEVAGGERVVTCDAETLDCTTG